MFIAILFCNVIMFMMAGRYNPEVDSTEMAVARAIIMVAVGLGYLFMAAGVFFLIMGRIKQEPRDSKYYISFVGLGLFVVFALYTFIG